MNRDQFIKAILRYLKRVPEEERLEVERYYNEMFDEAGINSYDTVPESFGDPKEIALDILTGLETDDESSSVFDRKETIENQNRTKNYNNKLLIIILAIIAAPIGIPIAITLGLLIITLIFAFGVMLFGLVTAIVSMVIALVLSPLHMLERIVGIGTILVLVGIIILMVELFKVIIKKISDYISRKMSERRSKK